MSNVIRFLEILGAQPAMSNAEYAAAVSHLDVGAEPKHALLGRDSTQLASLLGGRPRMICMVVSPEQPDDAPERSPDEQEKEEPEDEPEAK